MIFKFAALLLVGLLGAGCAAGEVETDASSGAQTVPATGAVRSLTGQKLFFETPLNPPFEEEMSAFAGISIDQAHRDQNGIKVVAPIFRLAPGAYTLSARGTSGSTIDLSVAVPKNSVEGATPRFMIFDDAGALLKGPNDVGMFEKVIVAGDTIRWETSLESGAPASGSFDAPGLAHGEKDYTFIVIPRNVAKGSIYGTHFFTVEATCEVAGCIEDPFAAARPSDDEPPRR